MGFYPVHNETLAALQATTLPSFVGRVSRQHDAQANAAGHADTFCACPPFDGLVNSFWQWGRVVRRPLIRGSEKSGAPAAAPSEALVSDRPTVFLTALNIPHHSMSSLSFGWGQKSLRPPE
jgi:hypothetical protein